MRISEAARQMGAKGGAVSSPTKAAASRANGASHVRPIAARMAEYTAPVASGCIEWARYRDRAGYGVVRHEGRNIKAHRMAWTLAHGPIPDGLFVLHRCDNPPCVNVAHLFLGTIRDNVLDAIRKGRWSSHIPPGTRRLTDADVEAIRRRKAAGESAAALGIAFGVRREHIHHLVRQCR